jgi:hypothetical protein
VAIAEGVVTAVGLTDTLVAVGAGPVGLGTTVAVPTIGDEPVVGLTTAVVEAAAEGLAAAVALPAGVVRTVGDATAVTLGAAIGPPAVLVGAVVGWLGRVDCTDATVGDGTTAVG